MKETNMEHYRSEIENSRYEISLVNGEVKRCKDVGCSQCGFQDMYKEFGCHRAKLKWLMSEYKLEPMLTEREKHFVEFVQEGWIARDENNPIFWHGAEPKKHDHSWGNDCLKYARVDIYDREIFPFITWKDESPWSVEELRKLKVKYSESDDETV